MEISFTSVRKKLDCSRGINQNYQQTENAVNVSIVYGFLQEFIPGRNIL